MPTDYTVLKECNAKHSYGFALLKNIVDHGGVYYFELSQILPQGLHRSKDTLEGNEGTPRCGVMT